MKNFLNKIWEGIKDAFWVQVPYLIYSIVWVFLSLFWATQFFKWYVKNFIG